MKIAFIYFSQKTERFLLLDGTFVQAFVEEFKNFKSIKTSNCFQNYLAS